MASEHSESPEPEQLRSLRECPVCRQTYKDPKILPCGHSVCTECCHCLAANGGRLTCPVCRRPSEVSVNNLPLNYGLRDFIQQQVENRSATSLSCVCCHRTRRHDDCWRCSECLVIVCSSCGLRHHNGHELQEIKPLVDEKQVHLMELRNWFQATKDNFDNRWGDVVIDHLTALANGLNASTLLVLVHRMEAATERLKQEIDQFGHCFNDTNVTRAIVDELHGHQSGCVNLEIELSFLQEKQELLAKTENAVLDLTHKFNEDLVGIVSRFVDFCNPVDQTDQTEVSFPHPPPNPQPDNSIPPIFQVENQSPAVAMPIFRSVVTPVEVVVPPANTFIPFRRVHQQLVVNVGENNLETTSRPAVGSTGRSQSSGRYTDSFRERLNLLLRPPVSKPFSDE